METLKHKAGEEVWVKLKITECCDWSTVWNYKVDIFGTPTCVTSEMLESRIIDLSRRFKQGDRVRVNFRDRGVPGDDGREFVVDRDEDSRGVVYIADLDGKYARQIAFYQLDLIEAAAEEEIVYDLDAKEAFCALIDGEIIERECTRSNILKIQKRLNGTNVEARIGDSYWLDSYFYKEDIVSEWRIVPKDEI